MHRPPPRRPRSLAVALILLGAACASDADSGTTQAEVVELVEVVAQPCDRPTRSFGYGVVVADDVVVTAAHTIEGDLRTLTADGAPATVIASDPRTDLALLRSELDARPADLTPAPLEAGTVLDRPVQVTRTGVLVVHDATDRARYVREVHTFSPGVEEGTSGAPLVAPDGRVAGVVVLDNAGDGVAYAVTAGELASLLDAPRTAAPTGCPD
jgi:S1-C subfamily serine protease